MNQLWSLRQNPYGNTDQNRMKTLILEKNIISCPFGHTYTCRNNVLDGKYNAEAKQQDAQFIEDMRIDDIVVIPFKGQKSCILAKIISDPIYCVDSGLYTIQHGDQIQLSETEGDPFRPVGRRIEIINDKVELSDMRILPMNSLRKLKNIHPEILRYLN